MQFSLQQATEILERTPVVMNSLLSGLNEAWTKHNEGGSTWSPYDIIGHLIHGERKDWMERMNIILKDGEKNVFEPFDRDAQFKESKGKALKDLLAEFAMLRTKNLQELKGKNLTEKELDLTGTHPIFGRVTLRQLLATWTAHDLSHINQITRVMAKQYKTEIGPWLEYMNIMNDRE